MQKQDVITDLIYIIDSLLKSIEMTIEFPQSYHNDLIGI